MGRYQGRTRKAALRKNRRKRSVVEVNLASPTGSRLAMRAKWTDWPKYSPTIIHTALRTRVMRSMGRSFRMTRNQVSYRR